MITASTQEVDTMTTTAVLTPNRSAGRTRAALVVAVLLSALSLAACGGSESSADAGAPAPGRDAAAVALEQGAVPIDVRTPEEYAAAHVEGSELIDVQSPDFATRIAELDPQVDYVVYCRSGNRSAAAAAQMEAAGLTVLDGGGLGDMVAAGWPETT
jgi:rhodanese-related sulfurtransferase